MTILSAIRKQLNSSRRYLGLEITDTRVKIAEMDFSDKRQPAVVRYVVEPLPSDTVEDGRLKDPLRLALMLKHVVAMNDFHGRRVHFVVPSPAIMVRHMKLPNVPDKQLKKVIDFEVKHNIHLPFEHPYYDFVNWSAAPRSKGLHFFSKFGSKRTQAHARQGSEADSAWLEAAAAGKSSHPFAEFETGDEAKEEAPKADVMLVAAPQELVEAYAGLLRECGLKPVSAEIKALSLHRLIRRTRTVEGLDDALLAVDINDTAVDISIFHAGQLKITRSVPIAFAAGAGSSTPSEADGLAAGAHDAAADFLHSCSDLAHELERLMNFYRYTLNNRSHQFRMIVLAGDIERLQEAGDYLQERLNQQTSLIRPDAIAAERFDLAKLAPQLAVPLGLALRGNEE